MRRTAAPALTCPQAACFHKYARACIQAGRLRLRCIAGGRGNGCGARIVRSPPSDSFYYYRDSDNVLGTLLCDSQVFFLVELICRGTADAFFHLFGLTTPRAPVPSSAAPHPGTEDRNGEMPRWFWVWGANPPELVSARDRSCRGEILAGAAARHLLPGLGGKTQSGTGRDPNVSDRPRGARLKRYEVSSPDPDVHGVLARRSENSNEVVNSVVLHVDRSSARGGYDVRCPPLKKRDAPLACIAQGWFRPFRSGGETWSVLRSARACRGTFTSTLVRIWRYGEFRSAAVKGIGPRRLVGGGEMIARQKCNSGPG